jgi:hypothetical protein
VNKIIIHASNPTFPGAMRQPYLPGRAVTVLVASWCGPHQKRKATGTPEAVSVERSSGNRDLDRAASSHVKRSWKFQGAGVTQVALLPIDFKLD